MFFGQATFSPFTLFPSKLKVYKFGNLVKYETPLSSISLFFKESSLKHKPDFWVKKINFSSLI